MIKIDLVYLWCDGNDPAFQERKSAFRKNNNKIDGEGKERFFDNQELKYSLRSVEKYANWIHHIFIITDRQIPKWLNTKNEKISIIDHSIILPKELIPCFNSTVIERYIYKIPGLSEYFLYGNDDTFFGKEISPNYFFKKGVPVVRVKSFSAFNGELNRRNILDVYKKTRFWGKSVIVSWNAIMQKKHLTHIQPYELSHNFDPYLKSEYEKTFISYKKTFDLSLNRFRDESDVNRILFSMNLVLNNKGYLTIKSNCSKFDKIKSFILQQKLEDLYVEKNIKSLLVFLFLNPVLFCINDTRNARSIDNFFERIILNIKFRNKSSYEI